MKTDAANEDRVMEKETMKRIERVDVNDRCGGSEEDVGRPVASCQRTEEHEDP